MMPLGVLPKDRSCLDSLSITMSIGALALALTWAPRAMTAQETPRWVRSTSFGTVEEFIDRESLVRSQEGSVEAWREHRFSGLMRDSSGLDLDGTTRRSRGLGMRRYSYVRQRILSREDCNGRRSALLRVVRYAADRAVVDDIPFDGLAYTSVVPETNGEVTHKLICRLAGLVPAGRD